MSEKELLIKLGEETIYSAKGHFKACDIRRNLIFDAIGLFGAIALLIWNEGESANYRAKHKKAAEQYLAFHKEIRNCYYLDETNTNLVKDISERVINFDQSLKPDIPGFARKMAKKAIESKNPETDNWFLKNTHNEHKQ